MGLVKFAHTRLFEKVVHITRHQGMNKESITDDGHNKKQGRAREKPKAEPASRRDMRNENTKSTYCIILDSCTRVQHIQQFVRESIYLSLEFQKRETKTPDEFID
jgi:hypothetical protein